MSYFVHRGAHEVQGAWAREVKAINALISDLVHPISETGRVIGAVAKGDLSQNMATDIDGRPLAGEFQRTALATCGTASTRGSSWVTSCRFAPVTAVARGVPAPSVRAWCFVPGLARSTGLGPVASPP